MARRSLFEDSEAGTAQFTSWAMRSVVETHEPRREPGVSSPAGCREGRCTAKQGTAPWQLCLSRCVPALLNPAPALFSVQGAGP